MRLLLSGLSPLQPEIISSQGESLHVVASSFFPSRRHSPEWPLGKKKSKILSLSFRGLVVALVRRGQCIRHFSRFHPPRQDAYSMKPCRVQSEKWPLTFVPFLPPT